MLSLLAVSVRWFVWLRCLLLFPFFCIVPVVVIVVVAVAVVIVAVVDVGDLVVGC